MCTYVRPFTCFRPILTKLGISCVESISRSLCQNVSPVRLTGHVIFHVVVAKATVFELSPPVGPPNIGWATEFSMDNESTGISLQPCETFSIKILFSHEVPSKFAQTAI